jgi:hypothetical protein
MNRQMTTERLTVLLAEKVMGWKVGPDRFMTGDRHWQPRWRFQPAQRVGDAFRLLEQTASQEYAICAVKKGAFRATVRIGGVTGEACESSQARALTFAIARAIGLKVDGTE